MIRGPTDVVAMPVKLINDTAMLQLFICAVGIAVLTCANLIAYSVFSPRSGTEVVPRARGGCLSWIYLSAAFFSPLMFIINISSVEAFFKTGGVPISEQPNLVGQWSTVMGAGLVIVAAAINKWAHHKLEAREEVEGDGVGDRGTVDSIHMVNNGQYKWEPGNGITQNQGVSLS